MHELPQGWLSQPTPTDRETSENCAQKIREVSVMSTYILIAYIMSYKAMAVLTNDFNSLASCLNAGKALERLAEEQYISGMGRPVVKWECVKR